MNDPWICPACGQGVAPWRDRCDHGGALSRYPAPPAAWPLTPAKSSPSPGLEAIAFAPAGAEDPNIDAIAGHFIRPSPSI